MVAPEIVAPLGSAFASAFRRLLACRLLGPAGNRLVIPASLDPKGSIQ